MDTAAFFEETMAEIGVTVGGEGPADIHIHDDRFYKRVLRDRELGLGETYQEGWWSANQLDEFLAVAQETNLRDVVKPSPALIRLMIESRLGNRQTERKAKKNAQAHYDIGNDLFERMLDTLREDTTAKLIALDVREPEPMPAASLPELPDFLTGHIEPLSGIDNSNDGDGSERRAALFGSLAGSPRAAAGPGGVSDNPYAGKEISRNAPCPCGSGNKYKHCHGAIGARA